MTSQFVQQARNNWHRQRRATRYAWVFALLCAFAGAMKMRSAVLLAGAHGLDATDGLALMSMRVPERLGRSFAGYEVVLIELMTSALAYLAAFGVMSVVLGVRSLRSRDESKFLDYVESLEARTWDESAKR